MYGGLDEGVGGEGYLWLFGSAASPETWDPIDLQLDPDLRQRLFQGSFAPFYYIDRSRPAFQACKLGAIQTDEHASSCPHFCSD